MRSLGKHTTLAVIILFALAIVGLQIWATIQNTRQVERIIHQIEPLQTQQLSNEKARQEVISLRIQNELEAFFWSSLLNALGPMITAFVALVGAWLGLRNYLDTRSRERLDRAAGDLNSLLENLVSEEPRERAVGVVGLQHFLTPDKREYHLRVLSALVTAARLEEDTEVMRGIRIAAEQAVKNLPEDVLRQVSWQGVKLRGVNFAGHRLQNLDFRDADLEDADLTGCDLSGVWLTNARLNGAKLDKSILQGADLAYADFAGASLVQADLRQAGLYHARVWRMNLDEADLREAKFEPDEVSWELINNWRNATYDGGLLEHLLDRYGPAVRGGRVLMLMWEIPPLVAGGTWTACYHLVRNLRQRGANVTVVVPWDEASILSSPFGCEVEVIPLGIVPPRYVPSSYAAPWSPYASTGFQQDRWSPYGSTFFSSPYYAAQGPYPSYFSSYAPSHEGRSGLRAGSTVLRLTGEFRKRFLRLAQQESFDVIHAHDWVTFDAAADAAQKAGKPWVAHFHSTEPDRRPSTPDIIIERIERQGALAANHIVVPSKATSRQIQDLYDVSASKITVVPNTLSWEEVAPLEMGSFESKRTIFLGRLTSQKAPDRFAQVTAQVRRRQAGASFWVFGTGEDLPEFDSFPYISLRGVVEWSSRGTAFSGATAMLVPSRSEPFGMVVLEAMQHRVPVLYPEHAGVAEVIESGIRIRPDDIDGTAEQLERLLTDWRHWEEVVQEQSQEIAGYPDRGYEQRVLGLWGEL
jgi:uncharacterized protein YjbI with pentapeptide repeats/glycosyltransferase involved in cell wall biosynthesis